MPGYTDAHKIGDYLGRTLTAQQFAQATQLVGPVEAYINRRTGRSWLGTSPTTDELHVVSGPYLYLRNRPVTAVTSVEVRVTETDTDTVMSTTDYTLVDAASGLLYVGESRYGWRVRVTYTHGGPALPEDLALAATMLGAYWLTPHLSGGGGTESSDIDPAIKRYSVGQDLTVEYFDRATSGGSAEDVPADIRKLIDNYRTRVKVFA